MKKKNLKKSNHKYSEKISINHKREDEYVIGFSLTEKETKLYKDWIDSLWNDIQIDDTEDSYVLYPKFQFEPYEMGTMITVIVGKNELLLRTAWEDDEVKKKKYRRNVLS